MYPDCTTSFTSEIHSQLSVMNYGLRNFRGHEAACHMAYAKRIAGLLRCAYAGEYESDRAYTGHLYFVPSDTLLYEEADGLGIHNEEQLLGGIVPAAFIATKAITHSLVEESAYVPSSWSYEFPARVQSLVHHGFSAFS